MNRVLIPTFDATMWSPRFKPMPSEINYQKIDVRESSNEHISLCMDFNDFYKLKNQVVCGRNIEVGLRLAKKYSVSLEPKDLWGRTNYLSGPG